MDTLPERFYRVSVKALILNEARDKFLICEEPSGVWELPGGGLEWGEEPKTCITREIMEEMGLMVTKIADQPAYFMTDITLNKKLWIANVLYETEVADFNFTPSVECVAIKFINREVIINMNVFPTVRTLAEQFDPAFHHQS